MTWHGMGVGWDGCLPSPVTRTSQLVEVVKNLTSWKAWGLWWAASSEAPGYSRVAGIMPSVQKLDLINKGYGQFIGVSPRECGWKLSKTERDHHFPGSSSVFFPLPFRKGKMLVLKTFPNWKCTASCSWLGVYTCMIQIPFCWNSWERTGSTISHEWQCTHMPAFVSSLRFWTQYFPCWVSRCFFLIYIFLTQLGKYTESWIRYI